MNWNRSFEIYTFIQFNLKSHEVLAQTNVTWIGFLQGNKSLNDAHLSSKYDISLHFLNKAWTSFSFWWFFYRKSGHETSVLIISPIPMTWRLSEGTHVLATFTKNRTSSEPHCNQLRINDIFTGSGTVRKTWVTTRSLLVQPTQTIPERVDRQHSVVLEGRPSNSAWRWVLASLSDRSKCKTEHDRLLPAPTFEVIL
jgi:hypothetical protein